MPSVLLKNCHRTSTKSSSFYRLMDTLSTYQVVLAKIMKQFHALPKFGPEKCPVYLRLQWLDSAFTRFEKQVKSSVKLCFSAREPRVVYATNELLSASNKDAQRLQDRIKQHFHKSIRSYS